jgi:hypothetical protein
VSDRGLVTGISGFIVADVRRLPDEAGFAPGFSPDSGRDDAIAYLG